MFIAPADELISKALTESNVKPPSAEIAISLTPTPALVADIVIVLVPASLAVIVKLVVSVESIDKVVASIVVPALVIVNVAVAEPMNNVLIPAVPIFIFRFIASSPMFISPTDELIYKALTESNVKPPSAEIAISLTPTPALVADIVIVLVPALLAVIVKLVVSVESIDKVVASIVAPSLLISNVVVVVPIVKILIPPVPILIF